MRRVRVTCALVIISTAVIGASCSDDKDDGTGAEIVIGAMYSEPSFEQPPVRGMLMAADEINASGVLSRKVKLVNVDFNSTTDRQQLARTLMDEHHAVAITSEFSSTAKHILQLTNDGAGAYADHVQCSGSSTNTTINDPTRPADPAWTYPSDRNDTLYRTVSNDKKQANLVWALVADKARAGLFYLDDAYGSSFESELVAKAQANGTPLAFLRSFPAQDFSVAAISTQLSELLSLNAAGTLTTLILVGLPVQGSDIIRELTEAATPFAGTVIVPDGMIQQSFFESLTAKFTTWMARAGNKLVGTAPETYAGSHSSSWMQRLVSREPTIDTSDAFTPSHTDCMHVFVLAMLYEPEGDGRYTAAAIKRNMLKLKQSYYSSFGGDVVDVSPDADGFRAARDAIAAGLAVRLNGASGSVVFDADGDRINQPYKTLTAESTASGWRWSSVSVYDGDTGGCISNCP